MRSHGPFQAVQISTEKEAKQGPETTAPQDPEEFKATPGPQLFTGCQCLSETEEQQNPQPVWDKEPKFWSDTLTQELWKLFRENPENQQAQEGEGPSLAGWGGVPWVSRQTSLLSISSSSPVVMATDRGAAGTGEYPWLGPPTHICPTMPLPLHPCTLLGAALDPQASAGFP